MRPASDERRRHRSASCYRTAEPAYLCDIAFRPELALAHLDLAELLVEDPGGGILLEARSHLDVAIPEFRE